MNTGAPFSYLADESSGWPDFRNVANYTKTARWEPAACGNIALIIRFYRLEGFSSKKSALSALLLSQCCIAQIGLSYVKGGAQEKRNARKEEKVSRLRPEGDAG